MPLTIAPGSSAEADEAHTPSFDDAINRLLSKAHEDNEAAAKCAAGEMAAKVGQYVQMIREQDPALAGDILELAGQLGVAPDQVKRDADTIRTAMDLEQVAKTLDRRREKVEEANEKFKALHQRHIDERLAMQRQQNDAVNSYDTAVRAEQDLSRLKRDRPELFS